VALTTKGKGAFRRFKDQLHEEHPGLLLAWYAFRDARLRGKRFVQDFTNRFRAGRRRPRHGSCPQGKTLTAGLVGLRPAPAPG
jgi:hypothetical protein